MQRESRSQPLVRDEERSVLEALARLADCNPFLPERALFEQQALGADFEPVGLVWHVESDLDGLNPNLTRLTELAGELAERLRERLSAGARASEAELLQYEALVRFLLFYRYEAVFYELIALGEAGRGRAHSVSTPWRRYARDVAHFLEFPERRMPVATDAAHLFAWGYQIRRAWRHTFRQIYGGSLAAARLRAAVWQSIFTFDPARYRRSLFERMGDVPTLVIGESGTGKELVARAIGLSRYLPFDAAGTRFSEDLRGLFLPVNLAALAGSLVESELFGHRRGAFTGADADRAGWFETCSDHGTVFLDEIGELGGELQVKLLRLLQSRSFQRVGEVEERPFRGKIIAATHRDLAAEIEAGRFRSDFYYRLSGDVIHTPSLREQLAEAPGELRSFVLVLTRRLVGEAEAESLASEVVAWVEQMQAELGAPWPWRGNVRELEQCVRNVMIRGAYHPLVLPDPGRSTPAGELAAAIAGGELSADELLRRYCTFVYAAAGSYEETARRLGLDRRTVKSRIDPELLARLRPKAGAGPETDEGPG